MIDTTTIYRAPPGSGSLQLGRTLPSLLDEACDRYPNDQALNQWQKRSWQSLSNTAFRRQAEEFALGLQSLGLQRGDRVALVMQSDIPFCIVDMGCLLVGLVNVPIDLTQTIENILFVLQHTDAETLVIADLDLLYQLIPYLWEAPGLQRVIVATVPDDWDRARQGLILGGGGDEDRGVEALQYPPEACLQVPHLLGEAHAATIALPKLPQCIRLLSLAEVQARGRQWWSEEEMQRLRSTIAPTDLATILYIASETKRPRGVMLTHENISADILASFSSHPTLEVGAKEVALMFLPLTHIFARAFLYGHLAYGHSLYFSDPNHVVKHLKTVQPTILITVPRLLEKIYDRILEQEQRLSRFDRAVFRWAVKLAHRYELGQPLSRLYALQLQLADRLVFARWRAVFGDRMKALICGGAALWANLANFFSAAGVPVLQGYGLTETSAVLCYNRGAYNRAGTVGVPIAGVEIAIADDGEILVRSPFVMRGYYHDPVATQRVLQADGWLHTGDLGAITSEGFLKITGIKKSLFKLATGKYVSPLPLEQELLRSPLVKQAIAVGANHKFCGMLIVPDLEVLLTYARSLELDTSEPSWWHHPCIAMLYQTLIDAANCHLPYWSTVRKFSLINASFTVENGLLLPDGSVNRVQVVEQFATEIAGLYEGAAETGDMRKVRKVGESQELSSPSSPSPLPSSSSPTCPNIPAAACPTYAKSLTHY